MLSHSVSSFVGTEAITEGLSYTKRRSLGLPEGVVHLFYHCAFVLGKTQSVLMTSGGSPTNDVHTTKMDPLYRRRGNPDPHGLNSETAECTL